MEKKEVALNLDIKWNWVEYLEKCQSVTTFLIEGKSYNRIKYGSEARFDRPCRNCAAINGQYHTPYCDWEECPLCHNQAGNCGCPYDKDEMKNLLAEAPY